MRREKEEEQRQKRKEKKNHNCAGRQKYQQRCIMKRGEGEVESARDKKKTVNKKSSEGRRFYVRVEGFLKCVRVCVCA